MTKTELYCDICKEQIIDKKDKLSLQILLNRSGLRRVGSESNIINIDCCTECADKMGIEKIPVSHDRTIEIIREFANLIIEEAKQ